jgi:hypothetical protein
MEKQIEELAIKLLNNIEKHTSLCENDYERNIFLQGVNEGYNAARKAVQGYREAFEKINEIVDKPEYSIRTNEYGIWCIINEALSKAEDKVDNLDELEYYQNARESFSNAVSNLDVQTRTACDSFILAFDRLLNCSKPQPTNSLDELERWVEESWPIQTMIWIHKDQLLSKIQELKTITP